MQALFIWNQMSNLTRIDELEMRITHQDKALADLNDVVLAQWKKIEALERQLKRVAHEFQNLESGSVPIDKPPHY